MTVLGMCQGRFLDVGMVRAGCWNFEMVLGYCAMLRFIANFFVTLSEGKG